MYIRWKSTRSPILFVLFISLGQKFLLLMEHFDRACSKVISVKINVRIGKKRPKRSALWHQKSPKNSVPFRHSSPNKKKQEIFGQYSVCFHWYRSFSLHEPSWLYTPPFREKIQSRSEYWIQSFWPKSIREFSQDATCFELFFFSANRQKVSWFSEKSRRCEFWKKIKVNLFLDRKLFWCWCCRFA